MLGRVGHQGRLQATTLKLLAYCEGSQWAGIDPYDALNSRMFEALPILDHRLPRLLLTQVLKRSPINVRPALLVPPTQNPKALGLFLSSLLTVRQCGLSNDGVAIAELIERIKTLRAPAAQHWCWGYSFPWQTRTRLVPRFYPNLVCTTFVANAFIDAYEATGGPAYLEIALSAAEFILDELFWTDGGSIAGFAYPLPSMRHNIHNGNLLGAALFCRVARHTGENRFVKPALRVVRYSTSRQHEDGSWDYGEEPTQRWIDNFHTGFNLCALRSIRRNLETSEFDASIQRGFQFYRHHFFREDGAAKYFHNKTYPIDIHCVAQSIITLLELKEFGSDNVQMANRVLAWAMSNMWDRRGFFYYRIQRLYKIRTSYMRWSQAWMLLAMSALLREMSLAESLKNVPETIIC